MRLVVAVAVVAVGAAAVLGQGTAVAGPECLVGTWTGNLEGWRGKEGTARQMVVKPPGADGVPAVQWGYPQQVGPAGNVKVSGETLTFVTGPGGKVEASCKAGKVAGSWTWNSKPYFFTFTKQN